LRFATVTRAIDSRSSDETELRVLRREAELIRIQELVVAAGALARCNGRDSNDGSYDRAADAGEGKSQNNDEPLHDFTLPFGAAICGMPGF
jgi:hypothetical protein